MDEGDRLGRLAAGVYRDDLSDVPDRLGSHYVMSWELSHLAYCDGLG